MPCPRTLRTAKSLAPMLVFCGLALLGAPRPALAQSEAERAAVAQGLFDKASALLDEKKFAEACPKLEEVTRLLPEAVGAKIALAECYEGEGKLASAWTLYSAVPPEPVRSPGQSSAQGPIGIAIGVLGIAGLGAGGALTGLAADKNTQSRASSLCDANGVCNQEGFDLRNEALTFADVATGLFIGGGVLAAGGLVLFLTRPKPQKPAVTGVSVGPGFARIQGSF